MTAHCAHLTWTSTLHRLKQVQREVRHINRSLQQRTVSTQVWSLTHSPPQSCSATLSSLHFTLPPSSPLPLPLPPLSLSLSLPVLSLSLPPSLPPSPLSLPLSPQLAQQLKERKTFFQRVATNMQTVLLDPSLLTQSMQYFCQLAKWMCMQTCVEMTE